MYPAEKGSSLHEFLTHSTVHGGRGPNSPSSTDQRYLVEDTANGLVPLSALGTLVKIKTPTVDLMIRHASVMKQVDYFKIGRNLLPLGLQGKTSDEILRFVKEGDYKQERELIVERAWNGVFIPNLTLRRDDGERIIK
jgi:opine dehydrogenase